MADLFAPYTTMTAAHVAAEFRVDAAVGLSQREVSVRRKRSGLNVLPSASAGWREIFVRQFRSPFIYLLAAAALLSLVFGELLDAALIALFVFGNAGLGFYQEYKSEQTVKLLQRFIQHRALVRRESSETVVESAALVPGDVVIVAPGDVIPADLRFTVAMNLEVNESVLTGESTPARKSSAKLRDPAAQLHQAYNIGFSGTTVAGGMGEGVVVAAGPRTVMGEIGHLAASTVRASSFAKGISAFSRFILRVILATLGLVFFANVVLKGGAVNLTELLIFSLALAVSVIPEALPVVMTFSLSRGALRLAKNKVVVKRLTAIEDLGSIDVLCTDKTGTLTENQLSVDQVYSPAGPAGSGAAEDVLVLACLAASFQRVTKSQPNNAFDLALGNRIGAAARQRLARYERLGQIPFDPERRRNTVLVAGDGRKLRVERGAPEEVVRACGHLAPVQQAAIADWVARSGREGRRVIAVASRTQDSDVLTPEGHGLTFGGLVSFVDPLKPSTAAAVAKAKALGIQVKILTGDRPEVAASVAKKIGLIAADAEVTTGQALDELPLPEQRALAARAHVFARVTPQQKYKIIQLLQGSHEVGFLGEGINDAPALKVANVAIAVQDAADVAQDAADVVLLRKSLQVIVDGIQEGREVFANTIKYIQATLASNFGNFYAVAVASLLVDFLPMLPIQIILLNLLSDFPMIAIATDTVDPEELATPRQYHVREIATLATVLGLVSTLFDFIFFALFFRVAPGVLQTNWFIGSILTELAFLFSVRTRLPFMQARRPSWVLLALSGVAAALTLALPLSAFGQRVFHFVRPDAFSLALIAGIVAVYFLASESVKRLYYRFAASFTAIPAARSL